VNKFCLEKFVTIELRSRDHWQTRDFSHLHKNVSVIKRQTSSLRFSCLTSRAGCELSFLSFNTSWLLFIRTC